MGKNISRRTILQAGSMAGLGTLAACDGVTFPGFSSADGPSPIAPIPTATTAPPQPEPNASFSFEVQRTEEAWRARLTDSEYTILREGGTEPRHSSPLATATGKGTYLCKGCDLPIYLSAQKIILPKGWAFFTHSIENSVLTGIDNGAIEAHCRRCGSHLGHVLYVEGQILHCINGSALVFDAAS
ncbi:MAG: peptide-methionine (R)-S-oxide reductase [Hyphomonadaceae bacterium]